MKRLFVSVIAISIAAVFAFGAGKREEDVEFPRKKPIDLVVYYAAGGAADLSARILAGAAPEFIEQRINVVNMPGGGGQDAIDYVMRQPADGYALLVGSLTFINTAIHEDVAYELDEWIPIIQIADNPSIFFTHADSPLKSMDDLIKKLETEPESLTVAHGRVYSNPHNTLVLFEHAAGVRSTHVATTGGAEALAFVLGKQVDVGLSVPSTLSGPYKAGSIRLLSIGGPTPVPIFPDTPTLLELGYDVEHVGIYQIYAHKGTPEEIISFLEQNFLRALASEGAKVMAQKTGVNITALPGEKAQQAYDRAIADLKMLVKFHD